MEGNTDRQILFNVAIPESIPISVVQPKNVVRRGKSRNLELFLPNSREQRITDRSRYFLLFDPPEWDNSETRI